MRRWLTVTSVPPLPLGEGINMLDESFIRDARKNAEGVRKFQHRATPWEPGGKLFANSERVRELNPRHGTRRSILYVLRERFIRELLQSSGIVTGS